MSVGEIYTFHKEDAMAWDVMTFEVTCLRVVSCLRCSIPRLAVVTGSEVIYRRIFVSSSSIHIVRV